MIHAAYTKCMINSKNVILKYENNIQATKVYPQLYSRSLSNQFFLCQTNSNNQSSLCRIILVQMRPHHNRVVSANAWCRFWKIVV